MIPKTEIRYSRVYNKQFGKNFSKNGLNRLKKKCEKFQDLYNRYIKTILKLIEKYHNKKWKHSFIPIYVVKNAKRSFFDPLTLKYKENEKMMLVILAHELLHNNSFGKNSSEIILSCMNIWNLY